MLGLVRVVDVDGVEIMFAVFDWYSKDESTMTGRKYAPNGKKMYLHIFEKYFTTDRFCFEIKIKAYPPGESFVTCEGETKILSSF